MIAKSLIIIMCFLGGAQAVKMSDYITPCSFKDPQLDDCARKQGQALLPHLVKGILEWGVPVMNPLLVPIILYNRTGGPFLSLHVTVTNSTHLGYQDAKFGNIKFDTTNLTLDADWTIDKYEGTGYYEGIGNVLQIPVSGKGFGIVNTRNVHQTLHVQFEKEERNGKMHLKPIHAVTDVRVQSIHYDIRGIFGNQVLSNIMNAFLNANSMAVYREVKSNVDEIAAKILFDIMSSSFANIPMNEMFKDFD